MLGQQSMEAQNFVDSDIPEDAITEDVIDQEEVETVSAEDENDVEPVDTIVLKKSSEEVEENDEEIMKAADTIIDLGPEGGEKGGYVLFEGPVEKLLQIKGNDTANCLNEFLKN